MCSDIMLRMVTDMSGKASCIVVITAKKIHSFFYTQNNRICCHLFSCCKLCFAQHSASAIFASPVADNSLMFHAGGSHSLNLL